MIAVAVLILVVVGLIVARKGSTQPGRKRRVGVGSAAAGTVYDLLNEDKRNAIEMIVEGTAESRRPEYPDGNKPDLESPKK